jgi:hypothetical protein
LHLSPVREHFKPVSKSGIPWIAVCDFYSGMQVLILDRQDNFYYHRPIYVWSVTLRFIDRRKLRISHFLCCTRYTAYMTILVLHSMIQEERSVFWEVIVPVMWEKRFTWTCV